MWGFQVRGERSACQDWHQPVRTPWPEPHTKAHQGQRSAGRCLVSTAAMQAGHPGETRTAEREAHKLLSSLDWHSRNPASAMLTLGAGAVCATGWQPGWRGTRVSVPARRANPAVPFQATRHPPMPRRGGWDSPSPTPHRCRAPAAGSPEAPTRLSDPGRLPHPGPQQSHKPPAAARDSSRGHSWGERGHQHAEAKGILAQQGAVSQAGPSAPWNWPPA